VELVERRSQPKALAVFFLSVVGAIIGSALVFNQLLVQTPKDERYEGYFNAANYHIFTVVLIILIQSGMSMYHYGGFASKTWKYLGFPAAGIMIFWITGTIEPHAGALSWVSVSYANINALRIGWEAKDVATYTSFARDAGLKGLGLTDKYTIVNSPLSAENLVTEVEQVEDYQTAFTGVMFLLVTLVVSGTISNGYYGIAFKNTLGSVGWSKTYQMAVVFSMLSFIFGFVATFVAWSSDAGANPAHPFYETVLGMASYHLIAATAIAAAVQLESRFLAEIALFVVGFFLLSGPTKLWQISALSETTEVKAYLSQNLYRDATGKFLESIVSAELDRYRTAVVLGVLQAVTGIYAMIKLLGDSSMKSLQYDAVGYQQENKPWKKNIVAYVFMSLGAAMVIVACALTWNIGRESLKAIGAQETYRMDAVNWYILMVFLAEGFLIVQYFENTLASLKPLWWIAAGILSSTIIGFNNVGTHDRQVWMVDWSITGANDLRAYLEKDDKDDFLPPKKAIGVDEGDYEQAFAAQILFFIGIMVTWLFSMKLPFSSCGSTIHWDRNSGVYSFAKVKSWSTVFVIFSFLFYVIALGVLAANDLADPAIRNANTSVTVDDSCNGEFGNMFLNTADTCWATEQVALGERFTLNTMTSWVPTDRKYWELMTFISIGFLAASCLVAGWVHGDARSVKMSALIAGVQWLSLEYAMAWDNDGNDDAAYPNPAYGSIFEDFGCKDVEDNGECGQYKAGFVILFLAAVFNIIAAVIMLSALDDQVDGASTNVPSTPSRSIPEGAQAITQEELQLAVSTPEKAMELARRIQEQGYLSVAAAEPSGEPAPSTMV